jgi:hypothetical protein
MKLNYEIWLPKLKFTLQTIALNYPESPNEVTIRKYYNLIQNLPVFFPEQPLGNHLEKLLDEFPVTPYMNSKSSFMKWIHFLFNKINAKIGKENVSFYDNLEDYYQHYKPKEIINKEQIKFKKHLMYGSVFSIFLMSSVYFYNKY